MGDLSQKCDTHVNNSNRFRHSVGTAHFRESKVYSEAVPRTDENGRQLKALLDYLLDGDIDAKDIYDALGVSSSTYYRRIKEADYPDAEELRRVADRFGLSYPDLQVRFGLMSHQEVQRYFEACRGGSNRGDAESSATETVRIDASPRRSAAVEFC